MTNESVLKSNPYAVEIAAAKRVLAMYPDEVSSMVLKVFRCQDSICSRARSLFIKDGHWSALGDDLDEVSIGDPEDVKHVCVFVSKHLKEGLFNELEHVPVPTVERLVKDEHTLNHVEGFQEILDCYPSEVTSKVLKIFKILEIVRKLGSRKGDCFYQEYFKNLEDSSIHNYLDVVNMCEYVKRHSGSKMFEDLAELSEPKLEDLRESRYGFVI